MNSRPFSFFTISSGAAPAPKFTSTTWPTFAFDAAHFHHQASQQIAYVAGAFFQLGALGGGNLNLRSQQRFRLFDRIHALELEHHAALVGPVLFQLQLAALAACGCHA